MLQRRVRDNFHDAMRGCSGHMFCFNFFRLRYRMADTFHGSRQKYFGEKAANLSHETTEEEAKSFFDERAPIYDQVIFILSIF